MTPHPYTEDQLVEQPAIGLFAALGWQTQGSGKSFSMVFFAQKVLRRLTGNWTFVVAPCQEPKSIRICAANQPHGTLAVLELVHRGVITTPFIAVTGDLVELQRAVQPLLAANYSTRANQQHRLSLLPSLPRTVP